MDAETLGLLAHHPWVPRRRLTVEDYHRMGDAGILGPEDRVELIEGELVLMSPVHSPHAGAVNTLTRLLVLGAGARAVVAVQNPIQLGDHSEPQPDFSLLRPRADDYRGNTPRAEDVLLVVEVADSSLAYDRGLKLALYARHKIPEVWIVGVKAREIEASREPQGDRYAISSRTGRDGRIEPVLLPGLSIPVAALFG